MALGKIGATDQGGVSRRSFTPEDQEGREFILEKMREAGLATMVDAAGNLRGHRAGRISGPPAMTGSHIDTVENGGKFDGALGVLAGIEVIRVLNDSGMELDYGLEVICFLAEEPSRFDMTCLGSRLLAGELTDRRILDRRDSTGKTLADAFCFLRIAPEKIFEAKVRPNEIRGFIELHVEQGSVLFEKRIPIGIVTDIVESYRYRLVF